MTIPIASDHAGYQAKEAVKAVLKEAGYNPEDFGTHSSDSVDYPDYAVSVSEKVDSGEYTRGILICGSGQGMCMTANKFKNVRAALVYSETTARLTRQHNNANILCLPGRELSESDLKNIVLSWLSTEFEGGRHKGRVNKIHNLTTNC